MSLAYRRAAPGDLRFVIDSFVESFRTAHAAGLIAMIDWRGVMTAQVERILSRPGCETWVAHNPDEPDGRTDLHGWCAIEKDYQVPVRRRNGGRWKEALVRADRPLVHYVFVKQSFRRLGIARGLLQAAGVDLEAPLNYSARTAVVSKLQLPSASWTPLICRYSK